MQDYWTVNHGSPVGYLATCGTLQWEFFTKYTAVCLPLIPLKKNAGLRLCPKCIAAFAKDGYLFSWGQNRVLTGLTHKLISDSDIQQSPVHNSIVKYPICLYKHTFLPIDADIANVSTLPILYCSWKTWERYNWKLPGFGERMYRLDKQRLIWKFNASHNVQGNMIQVHKNDISYGGNYPSN